MKNFGRIALAAVIAVYCSQGFSATEGTLGTSSTGNVNLYAFVTRQAAVVSQISITGLEDFSWGNVNTDSDGNFTLPPITISNVCVYMDAPGTFSLSLVSTNDFNMQGFNGTFVLYAVSYTDLQGNVSGPFGSGLVPSRTESCTAPADLSSLTITPDSGNLLGGLPDEEIFDELYDTLTLTVTPE